MLRSAAHVITLFCCILFLGAEGIAQPSASALNRIQTVVEGVRTPQHAHEAAMILRARPGVVMCRVDHNTRNIVIHVDPACTLSEAEMNVLLAPVEMSVHCFTRSPSVNAPFRKLDPKNCGIATPHK